MIPPLRIFTGKILGILSTHNDIISRGGSFISGGGSFIYAGRLFFEAGRLFFNPGRLFFEPGRLFIVIFSEILRFSGLFNKRTGSFTEYSVFHTSDCRVQSSNGDSARSFGPLGRSSVEIPMVVNTCSSYENSFLSSVLGKFLK